MGNYYNSFIQQIDGRLHCSIFTSTPFAMNLSPSIWPMLTSFFIIELLLFICMPIIKSFLNLQRKLNNCNREREKERLPDVYMDHACIRLLKHEDQDTHCIQLHVTRWSRKVVRKLIFLNSNCREKIKKKWKRWKRKRVNFNFLANIILTNFFRHCWAWKQKNNSKETIKQEFGCKFLHFFF